eukprot:CAMPEP_0172166632 /NCGR_PEP_ID=MMETSP1050-20130122/9102_1 /TAXON_ID=233186 /ORGANISM="Cryptomonas curvata, Strain CCAP979/52" /LENGTH=127 /DNA_ID=CAMNT_0012837289 /DNA_START=901 /DNA_END=1280 /DNA_ORIENTATION=+
MPSPTHARAAGRVRGDSDSLPIPNTRWTAGGRGSNHSHPEGLGRAAVGGPARKLPRNNSAALTSSNPAAASSAWAAGAPAPPELFSPHPRRALTLQRVRVAASDSSAPPAAAGPKAQDSRTAPWGRT